MSRSVSMSLGVSMSLSISMSLSVSMSLCISSVFIEIDKFRKPTFLVDLCWASFLFLIYIFFSLWGHIRPHSLYPIANLNERLMNSS